MSFFKNNLYQHRAKLTLMVLLIHFTISPAQNKLYVGFGGGINFSMIGESSKTTLFENLSGEPMEEFYSSWNNNLGNQYFFHIEYRMDNIVFTGMPGTYTHRFSKYTFIFTGPEQIEQEGPEILRYFQVPVGVNYLMPGQMLRPFVGFSVNYGLLLQQNGFDRSIIPSRFTIGPKGGIYIDLNNITFSLSSIYQIGLHNITRKSDRYTNNGNGMFAQSDFKLNDLQINISVLLPLEKSWRIKSLQCNY